jgi:hypothetical protein
MDLSILIRWLVTYENKQLNGTIYHLGSHAWSTTNNKNIKLKHVNKVAIQQIFQLEKVAYLNYVAPWVGGTSRNWPKCN